MVEKDDEDELELGESGGRSPELETTDPDERASRHSTEVHVEDGDHPVDPTSQSVTIDYELPWGGDRLVDALLAELRHQQAGNREPIVKNWPRIPLDRIFLAFHYYIKSKDGEWIETRGLQDERGRQFPFVSYGMIKLLGFDDESIDCDDAVKCRTIRGSYHTYGSIELVLKDHHGPRKDLFQVFDDKRPLFSECLQPPCRLDDNLIITFTMWEREKLPKDKMDAQQNRRIEQEAEAQEEEESRSRRSQRTDPTGPRHLSRMIHIPTPWPPGWPPRCPPGWPPGHSSATGALDGTDSENENRQSIQPSTLVPQPSSESRSRSESLDVDWLYSAMQSLNDRHTSMSSNTPEPETRHTYIFSSNPSDFDDHDTELGMPEDPEPTE